MKKKYTEDEFLKVASKTKFEGYWHGKKFYSNPFIEEGIIYFINEDTDFGEKDSIR